MQDTTSNNKRIAKNAIFLYMRMFISMAISFFTSRIVLQALGVSDFGIYNLVGGVVVLMGMINGALTGATSRFLTFGLGLNDEKTLKDTFSTAFITHAVFSLIFLILAETIGLWVVNTQLVIPADRLFAANWAYQSAIISTALGITQVPYTSAITAHERFGVFAAIDIINSILKLGIAFAVLYSSYDHLIEYSLLYMAVAISIMLFYRIYCTQNFSECHISKKFSLALFKKMISFTGWNLCGNLSLTISQQGTNIIFNLFFGTVINAALGIANQVMVACYSFTNNISVAFNPQIIKEWSKNNLQRVNELITIGARFSSIVTLLFTVPIICNIHFLLGIWLDEVPNGTEAICQITLISNFFNSFTPMAYTAISASGEIKKVNIICSVIFILRLPIAYIILLFTESYTLVLAICIYIPIASAFTYLKILKSKSSTFSIRKFITRTMVSTTLVGAIALLLCYIASYYIQDDFTSFISTLLLSTTIICALSFTILLDNKQRTFVKDTIKRKIN